MNSELFNRLKKIAQNEGRVVFVDRDEAFVLSVLELDEEYDDDFISDDNCGDDCSHDFFGTEEIAVKDKFESGATETDKELMKKVNEDIAKWRAEQEKSQEHESIKSQEQKEKTPEISDINSNSLNLEDEERYYLEPLE